MRYEKAIDCYGAGTYDGVGVMLGWAARGDTFVIPPHLSGLDYDGCIDQATGQLRDVCVRDALALLQTYAELSPSGTGVKVFVFGSLPPGRRRSRHVEMYSEGRFFTVTGHWLTETPWRVHDRHDVLALLHTHYFGGRA